jgi:signal transduction histidine kinase
MGHIALRLGILFLFMVVACGLVSWGVGFVVGTNPAWHFGPPTTEQPWRGGPGFGIFWLLIVLGGLGIFLTVRSLRRVARPVAEVMEAAERVADGDYAVRVTEQGPREMRNLTRSFNSMTERLEYNEAQRRALLADVTHELRTPLTVMQGNLEALLDGVYPRDDEHLSSILDETRVLARLVEDLRTLSLAESGALKLHKEPTDLAILIEESLIAFRAQSDTAGVRLQATVPDDLPTVDLDPVRIREVLANLIANALRHTPNGGQIEVSAVQDQEWVAIVVRDNGSGIDPADLPHVFDRFYKSEQSRGMGLGLAIARNLVDAHGGEITAESGPGGTTMRFTLPLV